MDGDVMEGFLCPICIIDLKSPSELVAHFEEKHPDDKDVLHQLKSVFSKAKRKILKENDTAGTSVISRDDIQDKVFVSQGKPCTGGIDLTLWEAQTLGSTSSHTKVFREQRKEAIEHIVVDTNKLIIRLGKLITSGIYASDSSLPNAVKTRKNVEKSVVPWDSDENAKACINCNTKFSMMFRRHHCRLCGRVVCEKCLDNLDMTLACGVLRMDLQKATMYIKFPTEDNEVDNGLKVCDSCNLLLIRQDKLIQDKSANTTLIQLYERMQSSMKDVDSTQPKFLKIAESLNAGETEFSLEVASQTRLKLLKSYESIKALSNRILQLGLEKEKQPSQQLLKLQKSIRQYALNFVTENMFTLTALPTAEKYTDLLNQKDLERKRLKAERAERISAPSSLKNSPSLPIKREHEINRGRKDLNSIDTTDNSSRRNNGLFTSSSSKSKSSNKELRPIQAVSISKTWDSSWGPVQVSTTDKTSSAVTQQIEIVKGYLTQARQAGKQDEVKLFEENLKELLYLDRQQREGNS